MGKLTTKQRAFVHHYLICWNASEAVRRMGYKGKNADVVGSDYLVKPGIQEEIQKRLAELKMSADEVLTRLSDHARGSADDFLTIERVKRRDMQTVPAPTEEDPEAVKFVPGPEYEVVETRLDFEKVKARGKLHLIKKISETKYGLQVEVYDAQAALALLGKHHKLFGDAGGVLKSLDLSKLSKEQVQRIADGDDPIAVLLSTDTDPSAGGA